jgi:hypothetical protein
MTEWSNARAVAFRKIQTAVVVKICNGRHFFRRKDSIQPSKDDHNLISELRDEQKPLVKEGGKRILLHYPQADHGMHALLDTMNSSDQVKLVQFLKTQRSKLGSKEKITKEDTDNRRLM